MPAERLAIFDVDGTLVDSTYHHAIAWQRAFAAHEIALPMWRIHREIGKGGDRLVPDLAGEQVERERGEALRELQHERYGELLEEVQPLAGAHDLLVQAKRDGWRIALASSGHAEELERYLELLDAADVPDALVSSADVESTKPAPDLLGLAREQAAPDVAPDSVLMIGDAMWDCRAARRAGFTPVAVLTGGIGREELEQAGAAAVFPTLQELQDSFDSLLPAA
ncbi:MAG TPA: HAD family hydrolase [Conexibacter sp.]|nr:HAD family hydrolase [Conexibacter sp.]